MLIDVNKYAILDKVPVHNAILIAESLLNDKSIFIRTNAERALLKAKAKLEKQKETIETDIQVIEVSFEKTRYEEKLKLLESPHRISKCQYVLRM